MGGGDSGKAGRGQMVGTSVGEVMLLAMRISQGIFGREVITPHLEFGAAKKWDGKGMGFGAGRSGFAFRLHHS